MRAFVVGTALLAVAAVGCASGGEPTTAPASAGPSLSASPSLSPLNQLDQLLNKDPGLLQAICNEGQHLISVGWPQEIVPSLLSGDIPLLRRHEIKKLEATGVPLKKAITIALERCP